MIKLTERLIEVRKKNKLKQTELASKIGIGYTTYNSYETKNITPPIDIIVKIARYFNVTTDYLLGVDSEVAYNELDKELLSYTNQLNDLEKAKVIGYAKSRVEQQKENKYNELKNKLEVWKNVNKRGNKKNYLRV